MGKNTEKEDNGSCGRDKPFKFYCNYKYEQMARNINMEQKKDRKRG